MISGSSIRLAPEAIAILESPFRRHSQAKWRAVMEALQAVSTVADGPLRSNQWEIRLEKSEDPRPVNL